MHARTAHSRRLIAVLAAVVALAAPAGAAVATDDPSGFLRDRPAPAAEVHATGTGKIVHQLICAESCVVSGRVAIRARDAGRLGLEAEGGRWLGIGRFRDVELEPRSWRSLRIRIGRRLERRLERSGVRLYGEAVAISLQSPRHGRAGWVATYRR